MSNKIVIYQIEFPYKKTHYNRSNTTVYTGGKWQTLDKFTSDGQFLQTQNTE